MSKAQHPTKEAESGVIGATPPGMGKPATVEDGGAEPDRGVIGSSPHTGGPRKPPPDSTVTHWMNAETVAAENREAVDAARKRSEMNGGGGNVYIVKAEVLHGPPLGTIAADTDFPKGTDFVYLIKKDAIEPADRLRSDPRAMSAEALEEIEELHGEKIRLERECERLTAENIRLTAEIERLSKK